MVVATLPGTSRGDAEDAVEQNLQIIGEAASHLPAEVTVSGKNRKIRARSTYGKKMGSQLAASSCSARALALGNSQRLVILDLSAATHFLS